MNRARRGREQLSVRIFCVFIVCVYVYVIVKPNNEPPGKGAKQRTAMAHGAYERRLY